MPTNDAQSCVCKASRFKPGEVGKIGHHQERVEFMGIASDLIIVVLAGLLGGLAARRLNQPLPTSPFFLRIRGI